MKSTLRVVALTLAACCEVSAACRSDSAQASVAVQDSAGVSIVTSTAPAWGAGAAAWSLDSLPAFTAASDPANPTQTLFGDLHIEPTADGRLVVANEGSSQLLVFDSLGAFVQAWGREGDGPGEFRSLRFLGKCAADTVVVLDAARLSILNDRGDFVRSETVAGRLTPTGNFEVAGVSPDCSSLLLALRHGRAPQSGERVFRYPTEIYWARLDSSATVPVGSFPGNEVTTVDVGGRLAGARFPFMTEPQWATDGRLVFQGPADRPEVRVFGAEGRLIRIVRWETPPEPIGEADWARYESWRRHEIDLEPGSSAFLPSREDHPNPPHKPFYSRLLTDDEGNLWVQRYEPSLFVDLPDEPAPRWWVLDPAGRWLGELTLPSRFDLRSVARGRAIGIAKDEMDVPRILGFDIRKTPG